MKAAAAVSEERFLVTGAMGCLGAWVIRLLLDQGVSTIGLDLSTNWSRLRLICDEDQLTRVKVINGDISEPEIVGRAVADHGVTHIVHCAALQVPFVRADPYRGARVNVVGTVNVFEAAKARRDQVRGLAYASSAAVFGPPNQYDGGTVHDDSPQYPESSLYGVFKRTNELMARVYAAENGIFAVGLRPFVVYGPGRDQGMTSGPTVAMLAALTATPYRVSFRGPMYFNFAREAAAAFIAAARYSAQESLVLNIPGTTGTVEEVIEEICQIVPKAQGMITMSDVELPSPAKVDGGHAQALLGLGDPIPLREGVAESIEILREGLKRGIVEAPRAA
jgi:nucleoside-diphosphate-sugar epimerase